MGLFDFLKKDTNINSSPQTERQQQPRFADSSTIDEDERPYYQPDEYYTYESYPGTGMGRKVITFDERKKTTYPSSRGLYVAEIMLLEYCSRGSYPKPKGGYPGLWWFEFGIRDVGHALASLQDRGFIRLAIGVNSLRSLTVAQLKELAAEYGLVCSGKKADIIDQIVEAIPIESMKNHHELLKYELTETGKAELEENAYVPYMCKHSHKTTEDGRFGKTFNVWDINKLLHDKDISKWREIVGAIEKKRFGVNIACEERKQEKKKSNGKQLKYTTEEMRQYLIDNKTKISKAAQKPGDGFNEEMKGIDLKKLGKDKEALFSFYVSICKKFDAPALYNETMILLRKYGLLEEEEAVCKTAIKINKDLKRDASAFEKRLEKIESLLAKEKPKADSESGITSELKRYKELLDEGIITSEEYEEKKKQILSL